MDLLLIDLTNVDVAEKIFGDSDDSFTNQKSQNKYRTFCAPPKQGPGRGGSQVSCKRRPLLREFIHRLLISGKTRPQIGISTLSLIYRHALMWRIAWAFTECTQPACEQRTLNPRPIIQRHLLVERFVERCFRFHFQARNSARRSRNQVMNYIFGISRRTEWTPTSMLFFISEDFGPKSAIFALDFTFRREILSRKRISEILMI